MRRASRVGEPSEQQPSGPSDAAECADQRSRAGQPSEPKPSEPCEPRQTVPEAPREQVELFAAQRLRRRALRQRRAAERFFEIVDEFCAVAVVLRRRE